MDRREALRWVGSVGIFYVLGPLFIVLSDGVYARLLPGIPRFRFSPPMLLLFGAAASAGAALIVSSIRSLIREGEGHPFDLTGRERLSRPTRRLLSRGVYYWCRNPMGLGDILLYAGIAGLAQCFHSLIINVPAIALLVWGNHRFNERPALIRRFGEDYLAYERTTSCLVPGSRTLRKILAGRRPRSARRG